MKAYNLDMALRAPEQVTELYLAGRQLQRLDVDLRRFPRLRKLDLSGNRLRALPPSLASCSQLEELILSGNALVALPEGVAACRRLRRLVLDGLPLRGLPSWLAALPALESLSANGLAWETLPEVLGQMPQLRALSLRACGLRALPPGLAWPALERLDLGRNALKRLPRAARGWTALRHLYLDGNELRRVPLEGWPQLETLVLAGNRLREWPQGLPLAEQLVALDLSDNRLSDAETGPCRFPFLRKLVLAGNRLRRPPAWLAQCPRLRVLDLSRNPLCGWPAQLCRFPALEALYLAGTRLSALPEAPWHLPRLATLDLRRTPLERLPEGWLPLDALKTARITERLWQAQQAGWLSCALLEQASGLRRAPTVIRFLAACRKAGIPPAWRPAVWQATHEGRAEAWATLPFALWWRCLDLPGRMGLLARQHFFAHKCEWPPSGRCWWLAGRLRRGLTYWRLRLEARGMQVVRQWSDQVTHVLVGRGLPEPPPVSSLSCCSEAALERALAREKPALAEAQCRRLQRILLAGQLQVAIPLLERYEWTDALPDAVLLAWYRAAEGTHKRRLEALLVAHLGAPARKAIDALGRHGELRGVPAPPFDRERLARWLQP